MMTQAFESIMQTEQTVVPRLDRGIQGGKRERSGGLRNMLTHASNPPYITGAHQVRRPAA